MSGDQSISSSSHSSHINNLSPAEVEAQAAKAAGKKPPSPGSDKLLSAGAEDTKLNAMASTDAPTLAKPNIGGAMAGSSKMGATICDVLGAFAMLQGVQTNQQNKQLHNTTLEQQRELHAVDDTLNANLGTLQTLISNIEKLNTERQNVEKNITQETLEKSILDGNLSKITSKLAEDKKTLVANQAALTAAKNKLSVDLACASNVSSDKATVKDDNATIDALKKQLGPMPPGPDKDKVQKQLDSAKDKLSKDQGVLTSDEAGAAAVPADKLAVANANKNSTAAQKAVDSDQVQQSSIQKEINAEQTKITASKAKLADIDSKIVSNTAQVTIVLSKVSVQLTKAQQQIRELQQNSTLSSAGQAELLSRLITSVDKVNEAIAAQGKNESTNQEALKQVEQVSQQSNLLTRTAQGQTQGAQQLSGKGEKVSSGNKAKQSASASASGDVAMNMMLATLSSQQGGETAGKKQESGQENARSVSGAKKATSKAGNVALKSKGGGKTNKGIAGDLNTKTGAESLPLQATLITKARNLFAETNEVLTTKKENKSLDNGRDIAG